MLNTPGKQDGSFTLNVNGRRVIERHDVFYRDVASSQSKNKQKKKPKKKKKKKPQKKPQSDPDGDLGDLLDPLLDGLFGRDPVWDRDWNGWDGAGFVLDDVDHLVKGIWDGEHKTEAQDEPDSERAGDNGVKPVGFLGLFFRCVHFPSVVPQPFLDIFIVRFSVGTTPSTRLPATNMSGSRTLLSPTMHEYLRKCFHISVH